MSSSFAVAAGVTVASSLFKVVSSSSFAMVAGVTEAPSLFNVVAGGMQLWMQGQMHFHSLSPP